MRKNVIVLTLLVLTVQNPQRVEAGAFATIAELAEGPRTAKGSKSD